MILLIVIFLEFQPLKIIQLNFRLMTKDKKTDLIFGSIFIALIIVLFAIAFRIGQLSAQIEQNEKDIKTKSLDK